ncbi:MULTISPECIES: histidine kinase [unclassified Pseudoxanthomonas]|uniref:sensor histidine kinase n=1 Tax=unclassified Pseudoxanthomonas TaxID=2645906 RepID=UPI003076E74A
MTSPLPGTPSSSPGLPSPDGSLHELEWHVCLRQLSILHEADRHTAARALHNQIGQAVSAIKMSAHLTLDEADATQRREDLLEIIRIADDTVAQLRDLHALLHPPQLESLGLEAALRAEAERLSATSPARVALDIDALPQRPAAEIELTGFRIIQQLLRQAAATGSPSHIFLQLRDEEDNLRLRLELDQPAPDQPAPDTRLLRTWATAVHGDLGIDVLPGVGIRFELRLPYALPDMPPEAVTPVHAPAD